MMKKTIVSDSEKYKASRKKKRISFLKKTSIYFFIFFLFSIISAVFLNLDRFTVKEILVEGINDSDAQTVKNMIAEQISDKYLFLFPKSNTFLLPKNKIKNVLTNTFLRFKDLNMVVSKDEVLTVSLSERKQEYIWCGTSFSYLDEGKECYFMDEDGYIFEKAPYFSGDVYFKFFGNIIKDAVPLGNYFLKNDLKKIDILRERIEEYGLKPIAFSLLEDGDMEFYLNSTSSENDLPPRIIFKGNVDFVKLVENLETVLSTEPLATEYQENYANLEYIDLRYGNKVYYRFR